MSALLRTMVFIAINNEWLICHPFREYEIKKEETTRSFLTKEEIRLLMDGKLKNAKQELTVTSTCSALSPGCRSPICATSRKRISIPTSTNTSG